MEATINPRMIDLNTDLLCSIGFRFLYGNLEKDIVSITARQKIVISARMSALRDSGKTPVKLVIRETMIASPIMNALLQRSDFICIR